MAAECLQHDVSRKRKTGATLSFPNLSVLHGATGFNVVRLNALTGATLSLPALTSIPDGAVQVLATNPNSVVDLTALATFADNTGGGNSFLEAVAGGRIKIPALTAPQFVNLVIDGATSQMDVAQITNLQKENVFARNGAVMSFPLITSMTANAFSTTYQAETGLLTLSFLRICRSSTAPPDSTWCD